MSWTNRRFIFSASGDDDRMFAYAQMPTPFEINETTQRIFFSSRDKTGKARPFYLDYDFENEKISNLTPKPVLDLGDTGTFDDSGIMASSLLSYNSRIYMYYIGWNRRVSVPFHLSIGLAISDDNGQTFQKHASSPVMDRALDEPFFNTTPFVMIDNGLFRMWYSSGRGWTEIDGKLEPLYTVRYAESKDGIYWHRHSDVIFPEKFEGEAIARPWVLKDKDNYKMWYSWRGSKDYRSAAGQHYRLGYAESKDGIHWQRLDEQVGLEKSSSGWDSEMLEYPSVLKCLNKEILLYNGNMFGQSGFGCAERKL